MHASGIIRYFLTQGFKVTSLDLQQTEATFCFSLFDLHKRMPWALIEMRQIFQRLCFNSNKILCRHAMSAISTESLRFGGLLSVTFLWSTTQPVVVCLCNICATCSTCFKWPLCWIHLEMQFPATWLRVVWACWHNTCCDSYPQHAWLTCSMCKAVHKIKLLGTNVDELKRKWCVTEIVINW